jgi:hypothetical protein
LTRGRRKQLPDSCQHTVMPIGHDEVNLSRSSCAQILKEADPTLFALLYAGAPRQHLFVAFQIYSQGCQNDRGIGLVPVANTEMHAVQVQDTPVLLKRTLAPGLKLLRERLVETTDGTGDFEPRPSTFGLLPQLCGCSCLQQTSG